MRMFYPGLTLAVAAKLVYEKWQERRAGEKMRQPPHGAVEEKRMAEKAGAA